MQQFSSLAATGACFHRLKQTQVLFICLLLVCSMVACRNNKPSGLYICAGLENQPPVTVDSIVNGVTYSSSINRDCTIGSFDFQDDDTVIITVTGGKIIESYKLDGDLVDIKSQGDKFILRMQDANTLISDKISPGTYRRSAADAAAAASQLWKFLLPAALAALLIAGFFVLRYYRSKQQDKLLPDGVTEEQVV